MKWTLIDVKKETDNPFLNYYTLNYDIEENGIHTEYKYYMVSRHSIDNLVCKSNIHNPDGVVICMYYIDKDGKTSLLLTRQFRPTMNTYLTSFPAGLIDKGETIFDAIKRESLEEVGANVTDIEILAKPGATSSGLSDEINSIALCRIESFKKECLEEFEDISHNLYSLDRVKEMLDDDTYFFPINIRILCLYLLLRFKK